MCDVDAQKGALFSHLNPDALVPTDHALRPIQVLMS